jgi:hypothetical protein
MSIVLDRKLHWLLSHDLCRGLLVGNEKPAADGQSRFKWSRIPVFLPDLEGSQSVQSIGSRNSQVAKRLNPILNDENFKEAGNAV